METERIEVARPGGPEMLRLVAASVPRPGPREVLVAVERAGVSFGDVMLRRHVFRDVPVPTVPGYDIVGRILEVGAAVERARVGDRIAAFVEYGGYARHALVREVDVVHVPDGVDPTDASAVILNYATAEMLLDAADVAPGDWFLVHGARGGVGSAVLDVARLRGLRAIGGVRARGLEPAIPGVPVLDADATDLRARVAEVTGDRGLGAVLEPRAGRWLWQSRALLRRGGVLVVSGLSSVAERSLRARLGAAYSIASIGLMRLDPTRRVCVSAIDQVYRRTPDAVRARVERLLGALARGEIAPRVGATLRLAEAAEAHRLMESGGVHGKIVLVA